MQLPPKTFYEHMSTNTSIYISNQQEETKPGPDLGAEQKNGYVLLQKDYMFLFNAKRDKRFHIVHVYSFWTMQIFS
jgi:hypothetical protein